MIVEPGHDLNGFGRKARIVHEGGTNFAAPDNNDVLLGVGAEDGIQPLGQRINGITAALVAHRQPRQRDIFAHQRRGNARRLA